MRRPEGVSAHDWQHRLIAERVAASAAARRRSGLDKLRARELDKKAMWTLRGHINQFHGRRRLPAFATIAEMIELHEQLTQKEEAP